MGEFVAGLRSLKAWSGCSYRELEKRAALVGDALPHSTVASSLNRDRLPREEIVEAFTRACGCPPPVVEAWLERRRHLLLRAHAPEPRAARITRRHLAAAGGVLAAVAVGAALVTAIGRRPARVAGRTRPVMVRALPRRARDPDGRR
ncbi:hypothetical protein NE235_24640 [Actinoallomurus spadix]|uniref:hypothetical protein n=1 Tax=Actinoallomurus spadix TaxID=79912 RepID=UPI002093C044|nr:hypothetical protein [Actinoallomurus spadix]MCO5989297.1 hypothetical protein [Actinoallomurus spadix]